MCVGCTGCLGIGSTQLWGSFVDPGIGTAGRARRHSSQLSQRKIVDFVAAITVNQVSAVELVVAMAKDLSGGDKNCQIAEPYRAPWPPLPRSWEVLTDPNQGGSSTVAVMPTTHRRGGADPPSSPHAVPHMDLDAVRFVSQGLFKPISVHPVLVYVQM